MVTAPVLAAVSCVAALADDPAASWPPPPPTSEGVDRGDAAFLDTREWKYASFFNRVKQRVAEVWNPMDAAQARDPTGSLYFNKDRTTVLSVTLDPQGRITEIKVARSSGLFFLDQTAIDAFEKAQPFVYPPPGLADARGNIRFTFGFHVNSGNGGVPFGRGWASRPEAQDAPGRELPAAKGPATFTDEGRSWVPGPQPGVLTVNPAPDCDVTEMSADVPPEATPFFDRLKPAVQVKWAAQTIARDRDPTGARYFTQDRCLILAVGLDWKGDLSRIEVRTSSDLGFLDQMATDSVWQVKAFTDPPRQQADPEAGIRFPVHFRLSGSANADWSKLEVVLE